MIEYSNRHLKNEYRNVKKYRNPIYSYFENYREDKSSIHCQICGIEILLIIQ